MKGIHFYAFPVLVAAVIQLVIAALWYGVGFKKRWIALTGKTEERKSGRTAIDLLYVFVMDIILSCVLANVIAGLGSLIWKGAPGFNVGASVAILCWFGFIAPPMLIQHILERRSPNLFLINAAYWVVSLAVSGGVLAVMVR